MMKENDSLQNKAVLRPYKIAIARYIRASMVLQNLKYDDIVERLVQRGMVLTASNLRNKVSKGLFSADMLIILLDILEVEQSAVVDILKQVQYESVH